MVVGTFARSAGDDSRDGADPRSGQAPVRSAFRGPGLARSTEIEGIPTTSIARTKLDLAAMLPTSRLVRVLERSEDRGIFDLGAIDVERRFRRLIKKAGLPAPVMNLNVLGYELDAYWEAERFAVELDVYETHDSRAAFERDRLRQEDLKLKGVEMIRVTGPRLDREPKAIVARVAAHLEQGRRHLGC
jgi:hypothetical protein